MKKNKTKQMFLYFFKFCLNTGLIQQQKMLARRKTEKELNTFLR